ncbi:MULTISPECIES: glutaredoxin family protein [Pseudomonas syringae group]|uniref:glutaredoxin family protein n=1 Tax=Pseudomonas syringae group TaxID=136849 RepID=UPI0013CE9FB2|nr:glutathione S-transferase N-terminal domain-containing protein [Pseudomonas viridiflava]MBI6702214.1 glutathione S-transferase N-terminal domain-containing protein [Pseudomonas viridiflava]MBI6724484.1 glutathione S-transferase N-terminal domain-containing protein [Pseudomonas viridiflava]MCJ8177258.1 glutathione S-transferase N-terminal domain-containing protein [Pseudomonas viridiflava]MEE3912613.1 glutathione S-transferase N-terminal domain-containing protein [Pseudomonas viridiflava]MEE
MFMKALRVGLGQLVIGIDFLTRPSKKKRDPAAQAAVDQSAQDLTLYQFHACPFCVKTRRALRRLNVPVALRDAKNNELDRQTLLTEGGRIKVPCLRIEEGDKTVWMYESNVIIDYLDKRFGAV